MAYFNRENFSEEMHQKTLRQNVPGDKLLRPSKFYLATLTQGNEKIGNIPTEMAEAISKFIVRLTSPPSLRAVHRYWPPSSSCKWIQMDPYF